MSSRDFQKDISLTFKIDLLGHILGRESITCQSERFLPQHSPLSPTKSRKVVPSITQGRSNLNSSWRLQQPLDTELSETSDSHPWTTTDGKTMRSCSYLMPQYLKEFRALESLRQHFLRQESTSLPSTHLLVWKLPNSYYTNCFSFIQL